MIKPWFTTEFLLNQILFITFNNSPVWFVTFFDWDYSTSVRVFLFYSVPMILIIYLLVLSRQYYSASYWRTWNRRGHFSFQKEHKLPKSGLRTHDRRFGCPTHSHLSEASDVHTGNVQVYQSCNEMVNFNRNYESFCTKNVRNQLAYPKLVNVPSFWRVTYMRIADAQKELPKSSLKSNIRKQWNYQTAFQNYWLTGSTLTPAQILDLFLLLSRGFGINLPM